MISRRPTPALRAALPGLAPGEVDARRALGVIGPGGLTEQDVRVAGDLDEVVARPGVAGVGQGPPTVLEADAVGLARMVDREAGDGDVADHGRTVGEHLVAEDVGEVGGHPFVRRGARTPRRAGPRTRSARAAGAPHRARTGGSGGARSARRCRRSDRDAGARERRRRARTGRCAAAGRRTCRCRGPWPGRCPRRGRDNPRRVSGGRRHCRNTPARSVPREHLTTRSEGGPPVPVDGVRRRPRPPARPRGHRRARRTGGPARRPPAFRGRSRAGRRRRFRRAPRRARSGARSGRRSRGPAGTRASRRRSRRAPTVSPDPVSQVPAPPSSQIRAVTATNWPTPPARARKPRTSSGSVLATRCAQPACSRGREQDPVETVEPAGCDTPEVERPAEDDLVQPLDHPQQGDERADEHGRLRLVDGQEPQASGGGCGHILQGSPALRPRAGPRAPRRPPRGCPSRPPSRGTSTRRRTR